MAIINPINAGSCSPYIGKTVCAVLHDGSRVYGYLKGVESDRLLLCMDQETAKTTAKKKGKKANAAAYSPYGFFPGGVFALELALIALLFAVPFFW